ncbi:MAG: glycosyltransferase family 1 protein [Burkholderiaceae bacterium]|jgi:glycosyltransferase involved in cell wall biosynthesis|nr:glycosyltransferase family 4 protein [Burkholderiaceae bacterium]MCZ8174847.1 glycosyltransferase family 1 protein [Burkholderiaceae bacterium]
MEERHIGISLGNIGALHDGLGEFSWQIGQRLAARAPAWRERHGLVLHVHCKPHLGELFGPGLDYIPVDRWQRWRHVREPRFALWHSLHQLNKTLPPAGTGLRLVTVHDLNYLYGRSAFSTWRHHRRTRALLARTDALSAISHHTAADVRRHLGWQRDITVIWNGARNFTAMPRRPLPGWSEAPERPFLFHLSRMSPSKNPKAILSLAAAWPAMRFVLCGPPSDDAKALRQRVTLPNVEFHLGINDAQKAWAYGACSGFLFPSLTEGFGLPPIEAMHFGKPVFLSRLTCLPEIGGDAAYYFDRFDGPAMRTVVEAGLARAAEPGRADAIRAHAAQFDWDRAADGYEALYLRLLGLLAPEQAVPTRSSDTQVPGHCG